MFCSDIYHTDSIDIILTVTVKSLTHFRYWCYSDSSDGTVTSICYQASIEEGLRISVAMTFTLLSVLMRLWQ